MSTDFSKKSIYNVHRPIWIVLSSFTFSFFFFSFCLNCLHHIIHVCVFLFLSLSSAVCLDGTLPGYHLHRGYGSGANSWLVQLEVCSKNDTKENMFLNYLPINFRLDVLYVSVCVLYASLSFCFPGSPKYSDDIHIPKNCQPTAYSVYACL